MKVKLGNTSNEVVMQYKYSDVLLSGWTSDWTLVP